MPEGQVDGHIDSAVRGMEVLLVPTLWKLGCDLLIALVQWYVQFSLVLLPSPLAQRKAAPRGPCNIDSILLGLSSRAGFELVRTIYSPLD